MGRKHQIMDKNGLRAAEDRERWKGNVVTPDDQQC